MCRRLIIVFLFILSIFIISRNKITILDDKRKINVEIKGEVKEDKVLNLPLGSTFKDVLNEIELTENSDLSNFSYLEVLHNNQIIIIPVKTNEHKISINNADIYELSSLPGVGKSIAKKIIDYRNEYGSFIKLEDIKNVSGIGDKKYEIIKEYICL